MKKQKKVFHFKEFDLMSKEDLGESFESFKTFASYEENHRFIDVAKGGNFLRLKNFVGVISTIDGYSIEILPKIYGIEDSIKQSKKVLFEMLRTIKNAPFKKISKSSLESSSNIKLFEIFITMFLEELTELVKKGIKSDYINKEENLYFLKGKMKLNSHLKHNLLQKEKFYVEYDDYSLNRVENKLIKATLNKLSKITSSSKNKQRIMELLFVFEDIESSIDHTSDFKKCKSDRTISYYEQTLQWCKLFLNNEGFCPYKGNNVAYAILFDMNLLFESYVAHFLKKQYGFKNVKTQHKKYKLLEDPKLFQLRPDIVMFENIVLDTKWKLIDSSEKKLGISQSDLYQMYAYGKKYQTDSVYLIYPKSKKFQASIMKPLYYDDSLELNVLCFDCFNIYNQDFDNILKGNETI